MLVDAIPEHKCLPGVAGLATASQKREIKVKATFITLLPGFSPQQLHREVHMPDPFEVECESLIPVIQPSSLQSTMGAPYLSPISLVTEERQEDETAK